MRRGLSLRQVFLGGLVVIFFGVLLQGVISSVAETLWPSGAVIVKAWKEIVMLILLPVAVVLLHKQGRLKAVFHDRIMWVTGAIVVTTLLSGLIWTGLLPFLAGIIIDLRGFLYFILVYAAVKIDPQFSKRFAIVALIGSGFVIGLALLEWLVLPKGYLRILGYGKDTIAPYLTVDDYPGLIRLQSSLRGPNPLGAFALISATLSTSFLALRTLSRRGRIVLALLLAASVAVAFGSYSRSAYLGLGVAAILFVVLFLVERRRVARRLIVPGVLLVCLAVVGVWTFRDTTFVRGTILHEVPGYGPSINSNAGHASSLSTSFTSLITHPLGKGVGSTGSASLLGSDKTIVENQYLFVSHESGWLGLGLYVVWLGMVLRRAFLNRRELLGMTTLLSGVGLAIVGLFLPVFADDTIAIIWFGLAGCISAIIVVRNDYRASKQKTTGTT